MSPCPLGESFKTAFRSAGLPLPDEGALAALAESAPLSGTALLRRQALVPLLRAQNHDREELLQDLLNPDTLLVVTGQQAGLMLGPAYTIHKCAGILALCDKLQREHGRPAVALFWIESNDHDWDEACRVTIPGQAEFKLPQPKTREGHSLGRIPMERSLKRPLMDFIAQGNWHTDLATAALAELENSLTPADFFQRLLRIVFPDTRLLCLDPSTPALRSAARDFYPLLAQKLDQFPDIVDQANTQLQAVDLPRPLTLDERVPWFVSVEGRRQRPVDSQQAEFSLKADPDRLSPNVLSRPLLLDWLLAPQISVLGPSEMAYTLQLQGLHVPLEIPQPLYWPRPHISLVAHKDAQLFKHNDLSLNAAPAPGLPWPEDFLRQLPGMDAVYEKSDRLRQLKTELSEICKPGDRPDLNKLVDRATASITQIEERLVSQARKAHKERLRELQQVGSWLDQSQSLQERRVNSLALLDHCGLKNANALTPALDPLCGDMQRFSCDGTTLLRVTGEQ